MYSIIEFIEIQLFLSKSVISFWEFAAFIANSLIFMLIGIRGAYQSFANLLPSIAIAIVLMFVGRALAIYPLSALLSRSVLRISQNHQHVLFGAACMAS